MRETLLHWRVLEFVVAIALLISAYLLSTANVHQRAIPFIQVRLNATTSVFARDPSLDYAQKPEQVTHLECQIISIAVPLATNLVLNIVLPWLTSKSKHKPWVLQAIQHDTRDFVLSLLICMGISSFFTQFLKTFGGRLRPCFYQMCKWQMEVAWDGQSNLCSSSKWEKQARKSFPSGHTSLAFATLFFLTLYLLGRSRVVLPSRHQDLLVAFCSGTKLVLCLLPTLLASWIALTRTMDNWHTFSDVLAGAIVGMLAAVVGYWYNYNSVFHVRYAGLPLQLSHAENHADQLPAAAE